MNLLKQSCLNFGNSTLLFLPTKSINQLQLIQNRAAHLICKGPWCHHISPFLKQKYWLSVYQNIVFRYTGRDAASKHGRKIWGAWRAYKKVCSHSLIRTCMLLGSRVGKDRGKNRRSPNPIAWWGDNRTSWPDSAGVMVKFVVVLRYKMKNPIQSV